MSPILSARGGMSAGAYGWGAAAVAEVGAFESIATITASGSQSSLTFSSIPSTYKHLQVRGIARDGVGYIAQLRLNSDSSGSYSFHRLYGQGASVVSNGGANQTYIYISEELSSVTSTLNGFIIDVLDYASTSKLKTVRCFQGFDGNGSGHVGVYSGMWISTSAISSITITNTGSQNFTNTSTFALYGIKEKA